MFYGWVILLVLCYAHYFLLCGWLYTYGPTLTAMIADFGSTMTVAAAAKTCNSLACALLALVVGWVIAKHSAKLCLLVGAVAGTLGSALMYWYVDSMPQYFVCCTVLLATMSTFGSGIAAQTILSRWFLRRRSMVLGILMASGGVGGFTFPGITTVLMERTGTWRTVWLFVLFGCVSSFVLSLVLLKDRPEQKGTHPDGVPPEQAGAVPVSHLAGHVREPEVSWRRREAIRTPLFRAVVLAYACSNYSLNCVSAYAVATFTDKGLTLGQAAAVLSIFAFANFITRLLSGVVMDVINPRFVYGAALLMMAGACLMVPFIATPGWAYLFGALYGLAFGVTVIGPQTLLLKAFGVEHFSQISALQVMIDSFTVALLTLLPGIIRDRTGSFNMMYLILAAALLCGSITVLVTHLPKQRPPELAGEEGRAV